MGRRYTLGFVLLVVILLPLPATLGFLLGGPRAADATVTPAEGRSGADSMLIKVYFPDTRQIQEMPLGEYLKGVVAAEMPSAFHPEALKAQFVAARTFAVRRMRVFQGKGGCSLNTEADVCADPKTGQAYITQAELVARDGISTKQAADFWNQLEKLERDTEDMVLLYNGALIDPLFHSVSGTVTEDAASYFGQDLPYLRSVDDHWGKDAPKLHSTTVLQPMDMVAKLSVNGTNVALPALASSVKAGQVPVQILSKTQSGRVGTVKIAGVTLTGREVRERLNLNSTNFTVSVRNGQIVIETTGNGHGVGMSQWGANGMAKEGKGFKEILNHYYQGTTISTVFRG